jgi:hypothetical protein
MIRNLLASVISVLLFIGSSALAQTSTWTIDTNQTQVGFQIRQVPISNVRGSFSGFTAELTGVVSARVRVWVKQSLSPAEFVSVPSYWTSLAPIIGPMATALKLGEGSGSYALSARALVAGLLISIVPTVFWVPTAFHWVYGKREPVRLKGAQGL